MVVHLFGNVHSEIDRWRAKMKEGWEEKKGVHNVDENQKGEQGRERWCS